jgi:hypothetical protein
MAKQRVNDWLVMVLVLSCGSACQREGPTEKAGGQPPAAAGVIEQTAQQAVDHIKGPMDKARAVEETIEKAAERRGEPLQGAIP